MMIIQPKSLNESFYDLSFAFYSAESFFQSFNCEKFTMINIQCSSNSWL